MLMQCTCIYSLHFQFCRPIKTLVAASHTLTMHHYILYATNTLSISYPRSVQNDQLNCRAFLWTVGGCQKTDQEEISSYDDGLGRTFKLCTEKKRHQLGFEPETVRQCCYLLQCALLRILCLCQDTLYMYHMCSFLCCFTVILFGECPITLEISAGPCLCGNLGKCDVNTDFSCNSAKVPPELCHQCPIKHTYRHVIYSFTCAEIPRITVWWWSK